MKFDFRKTLAGFFINVLHNFFIAGKFAGKNVRSSVNELKCVVVLVHHNSRVILA